MKKVLIIEDEKIIRETVAHYFSHDGYDVITAEDGQMGLELFAAHDHDVSLIILDIMLPAMDGWSICRRIRKSSNVPIIFINSSK